MIHRHPALTSGLQARPAQAARPHRTSPPLLAFAALTAAAVRIASTVRVRMPLLVPAAAIVVAAASITNAVRIRTMARRTGRQDTAHLRIGDAERDHALTTLKAHYAAGRLNHDELLKRVEHALAAATRADLTPLLHDLPTDQPR